MSTSISPKKAVNPAFSSWNAADTDSLFSQKSVILIQYINAIFCKDYSLGSHISNGAYYFLSLSDETQDFMYTPLLFQV